MKNCSVMHLLKCGLTLALITVCMLPFAAMAAAPVPQIPTGPRDVNGNWATPDYYTTANWANSPPLAKFVDTLPGLTPGNANNLGQYLSVGKPDIVTYPGSDYYEIDLVQYREHMHSDLPLTTGKTTATAGTSDKGTLLRGYVQVNKGTDTSICGGNLQPVCGPEHNTLNPDPPHYLGPNIVGFRDRPVRIKFRNRLPAGVEGDLFVPTDTSIMGAGSGPAYPVVARGEVGAPCNNTVESNTCASYPQNRSDIHLHGGRTPWISDGTPHQWITPVEEITPFTKGVSFYNVPDMPDPGDGATTYYWSNQQSARLLFYHEHAWGITRLNPYVGVAAGYVLTDQWEQDLISRGILPPFLDQIPLVIQDRTFVDATPTTKYVYNTNTGLYDTPITVPKVRETDPLWNWGSGAPDANGVRPPVTGDFWMPHVYLPAQTQLAGGGGVNPFGRWMYGPWFYPATVVAKGPVANPYYDPNCSSSNPFIFADCQTPGQPTQIPGTPHPSMGMEAFQDSAMVNGTAFPTLTVDPRVYRFRILNAASDRFWNLNFYKADPAQISPDPRPASRLTEVKMADASPTLAAQNNWPADWPIDGRVGGVPDPGVCQPGGVNCSNFGPSFLQIGTEGGFLPQPVEHKQQPITWVTDPTAFWFGIVDKMGLAVGPAERADVLVDFSQYAGQTLILYNDAPAAWPAGVPSYDYYTGAPDMRDTGGYGTGGTFDPVTGTWVGGTGPLVGYAPNTRTIMQVIVRPSIQGTPYTFNRAALEQEFTGAAPVTAVNPAPAKTLFERSQEPIIVGQAAYASTYPNSYFPANFPWEGINQINDHFLNFVTLTGQQVHAITEPKGLHDEMGASFDPIYGRMSGNLGMQLPNPTNLTALLVLYAYSDLPSEVINNSTQMNVQVLPGLPGQPGTLADGTQIWKISHNGVDTHPIHFHIFDVQLVNRVGWDGQIRMPEPNELGWKDTVKISPLMDTIVAVRPKAPALPFGLPNSIRPLNPGIPIDSNMNFAGTIPPGSNWPIPNVGSGFNSIDWNTGLAYVGTQVPPYPYPNFKGVVTNVLYDFGWEYVWHCHILSHEEMDMMRSIVLNYQSMLPPAFNTSANEANGNVTLTWNDPTPVVYTDLSTFGNPANEVGFNVYKSVGGVFPVDAVTGKPVPVNTLPLRANSTSYTDTGAAGSGSTYIVEAFNNQGSTVSFVGSLFSVNLAVTNGPSFTSPGPVNLQTTVSGVPTGVTITQVNFYDGNTLIGSTGTAPYTLTWNSATVGTHTLTAKAVTNILGASVESAPVVVTVGGTLTADFVPNNGASYSVCDIIPFTSTSTASTGTISGYSWLINGTNYTTPVVNVSLPAGVYPVTLSISNSAGETAQVTKTITSVRHNPIANTGGPYVVNPGGTLRLSGTGSNPLDPCSTITAYGWNLDGKAGYEFLTANPSISYNALVKVLGVGTHAITLMVTDSNGGIATATTTVTVNQTFIPVVRMNGVYYPDLQAAYDVAPNNATIQLAEGVGITGNLVANRNITVAIAGGYDSGFNAVTGVTTTPNTIVINRGKVIVRAMVLQGPGPVITTPGTLPSYTIGTGVYSTTFKAVNATAPYTYTVTAGTLPAGLTLASDGLLSGTPTTLTPGTYNFTVTVQDSSVPAETGSHMFTLSILAPPLVITTTSPLASGQIAVPYSAIIAATGGVSSYSYAVTAGSLPAGLSLAANGQLTGTPSAFGTFNFTVTVTDSAVPAVSSSAAFTLVIQPAPLVFTTTSPLPGYSIASGPINVTFAASGGVSPYTFASPMAASMGFTFNSNGQMSGTPTVPPGTWLFTVTVTDSAATPVSQTNVFSLTIAP